MTPRRLRGLAAACAGALLGALLLASGAPDARAQNGDGTPADSLAADSLAADSLAADSLGYGDDAAGATGDSAAFHPSLKLGYRTDRDYSTLNQSVQNLTFRLGERLNVTTGANNNQKTGRTLSNKTQNRNSNSTIRYELFPSVTLVSNLQFSANENRTQSQKRTVSNDNFDIGTAFERKLGAGTTARFDLFAGTNGNKNAFYESRGRTTSLKSGILASPRRWLTTGLDYEGSRGGQTSRYLNTGGETEDESREQKLNGRVTFNLPASSSVVVSSGWDQGTFQRPDTLSGDQETKTLRNRSAAVSATILNVKKLTLNLDGDWARRLTDYALTKSSYLLIKDKGGKLGARYKLTGSTEVGLSYSDRLTRSEFQPDPGKANRTGDTVFRSVNGSLSQRLGSEASVEISGKADLQRYIYDDTTAVTGFQEDRDVLDQRVSVSGSFRPFTLLNMQCEFSVLDRRTVNILASRSSNNNRAQTYALRPTFTFTLSPRITVSQRYSLDATYTEFSFDDNKNTVARTANVNSSLNYDLTRRVRLTLSHDYRDSDQGKLIREGGERLFARSAKNERQEMNVSVDYSPAPWMRWSVQERLQLERRWTFDPDTGDRRAQTPASSGYFTGKVDGRLQPWPHFNANYGAALNLGRGDRITAAQRRYWTANVDVTYTY